MRGSLCFFLLMVSSAIALAQEDKIGRTESSAAQHKGDASDPIGKSLRIHLIVAHVSLTKLQESKFDLSPYHGKAQVPGNGNQDGFRMQWSAIMQNRSHAERLVEDLRKRNLVRILTETDLSVHDESATFRGGEQLSVPTKQTDNSLAMVRRPSITGKIAASVKGNAIDLVVHAEIARFRGAQLTPVEGQMVPAVDFLACNSRGTVQSGETLVLVGPTEVHVEAINKGTPWLSELPLVGRPFRKTEQQRNEIAALVLVRPEIPRP